MPYRYIRREVKDQWILMVQQGMKATDVAHYTRAGACTISRVQKNWCEYGSTVKQTLPVGRKHILMTFDLDVRYTLLFYCQSATLSNVCQLLEGELLRKPDMLLSELHTVLIEQRGVDMLERTIARSILCRGFSRKMVCVDCIPFMPFNHLL
jgi:hypothetical protein